MARGEVLEKQERVEKRNNGFFKQYKKWGGDFFTQRYLN